MESNFNNSMRRYQASWSDNTPPNFPRLNPSARFFNPTSAQSQSFDCPLCVFSTADPASLQAHFSDMHPGAYQQPAPRPRPLFQPAAPPYPPLPSSVNQATPWQPPPPLVQPGAAPLPPRMGQPAASAQPVRFASLPLLRLSDWYCNVCHVQCESHDQHRSHCIGRKHQKRVEMKRQWDALSPRFPHEGISGVEKGFWECSHCHMMLKGQTNVIQHLYSTKHKKQYEFITQRSTKRQRGEEDLDAALRASKSAATEEKREERILNLGNLQGLDVPGEGGKKEYSCSVCRVSCTSQENLNAHLTSTKHKKKVALLENGGAGPSTAGSPDKGNGIAAVAMPSELGAAPTAGAVPGSMMRAGEMGSTLGNPSSLHCDVCNINCCGPQNFEAHLKGKMHAKKVRQAAASKES